LPRIIFLSAFLLGCSYSQSSGEDNSGSDTRDCTTQQREDCGPNANCFFKPTINEVLCACYFGGLPPNCHEPGPADRQPQYGCGGENVPTTSATYNLVQPISGDSVTAPNQYPWMVRLPGCGGSLISDRHVITARHCVYPFVNSTVKLGAHDQYNRSAYQEVEVEDAYFPPGVPLWNDIEYKMNPDGCHDLAILLLKEPVKFNTTVQPVCLPSRDDLVHVGQKAMAMGWGVNEYGDSSELLKHLDVEIIATKEEGYCGENFFSTGRKKFASNGVLEGALHGDSGGPLVYKDPMSNSWKIIGVLAVLWQTTNSWHKVTAHLDWIDGILAEHRTK